MSSSSAVCLKCGHFKARALFACPTCGFVPRSADDTSRSLILSSYFDGGESVIGLSAQELADAASQIQAGMPYPFDPAELARVSALHKTARSFTGSHLLLDGLRWLLPPAALLLVFAWILWHK
jgi:hypothetical protein